MTDTPYDTAALGVGTLHYETDAPRVKSAPDAYEVERISESPTRISYRVNTFSTSGNPATVTYHKKSRNLACQSHHTANQCVHCAAVREYRADTTRDAA